MGQFRSLAFIMVELSTPYTKDDFKGDARRLGDAVINGSLSGFLSGSAIWAVQRIKDGKTTIKSSVQPNMKGFARTALFLEGSDVIVSRARKHIMTDPRPRLSDKFYGGCIAGFALNKNIPLFDHQRFRSALQYGFFSFASVLYESIRLNKVLYAPPRSLDAFILKKCQSFQCGRVEIEE